jgi:hypothetical protein
MVADVLEHLDRDDAIEAPGGGDGVDVAGDDRQVGQAALARDAGDVGPQ